MLLAGASESAAVDVAISAAGMAGSIGLCASGHIRKRWQWMPMQRSNN